MNMGYTSCQESLKTSENDSLVTSLPAKMKILLILAKKSWKPEIEPLPHCTIPNENES